MAEGRDDTVEGREGVVFAACVCFCFTVSVKERGRPAGDFISQRDGWVPSV